MSATEIRNDIWAEHAGIPEYVCHKRVRASEIVAIGGSTANEFSLLHLGCGSVWQASDEWVGKHRPAIGGYLVFYNDGYVSYSPAKAFKEGYAPQELQP
jgi:hypothetical protein